MARKEAWRRIHEFPDYEVNARGHVRRTGSNQKVLLEKGLIDYMVKLWHKGDAKKFRTADLVAQYFPELQEGGSPIEWKQLKEFPDYEVTVFGSVRNRATKYELPVVRTHSSAAEVTLWRDGVRRNCSIVKLLEETFASEVDVVV